MDKQPCVYILASDLNGTLYVGVTSNLIGRVYQPSRIGCRFYQALPCASSGLV